MGNLEEKDILISEEQFAALHHLNKAFHKSWQEFLKNWFPSEISMETNDISEIAFDSFMDENKTNDVFFMYNLNPYGPILFSLNEKLLGYIIDRSFCCEKNKTSPTKKWSEIDLFIAEKHALQILVALYHANQSIGVEEKLNSQLICMEERPAFVKLAEPNEKVVLLESKVTIDNVEGVFKLVIPSKKLVTSKKLNQVTKKLYIGGKQNGTKS